MIIRDKFAARPKCGLACGACVISAAWPCVASLSGDFFPAQERAGIYGLIIVGEMIGAGIGFFVSGEVSSFANWRWSFFVMASPAVVLVWVLWRGRRQRRLARPSGAGGHGRTQGRGGGDRVFLGAEESQAAGGEHRPPGWRCRC